MRRRVPRPSRREAASRGRPAGALDLGPSGAPRRGGRRSRDGRRRRDPDPAPARLPPRARRRVRARRRAGPAAGRGCAGGLLPAERRGPAPGAREGAGGQDRGRGPDPPGLARRPDRPGALRQHGARGDAGHPPPPDRPRAGHSRPGRVRAQAVRDPPHHRAADDRDRVPLDVVAHGRLQGDAERAPAVRLLRGPPRPGAPQRAGDRPLAVLDQHLPELGPRAPAPDERPQRRDQHDRREHQLDAGAGGHPGVAAVRRRTSSAACRSSRRGPRTRSRSTTCSSCSAWPAARSPTPR